jgi:putative DNA primase/helicase
MPGAFETIASIIDSAKPFDKPLRWMTPPAAQNAVGPSRAGSGRGRGPPPPEAGGPPSGDEPKRPVIQLVGGQLPLVVDKAEQALIASKPDIYRYGGQLVRPVLEEVPAADMTRTQVHRLLPVTRSYLVDVFTSAAHWQRFDRRREDWGDVDCPDRVAEVYLAREGRWRLPALVGIINAPMLRADGSYLDNPGYDERTGLLFRTDGVKFGRVPVRPTRADAEKALCLLQDLIATFPFVGDGDRSVALSAILSALDRRSMDAAPMHAFSAPVAGSGKTMLVDLCSMIATGRKAPVLDQSKDDIETDKRLVAALLRGGAIIAIDNVDRPLDSALLCQALTSSGVMQLRVLGSSRDVDVPNTAMFYATGNNLILAGDLTRRTLLCRLDPGCERPELREFGCDPLQMAKEDRSEYVVAAITILRAYLTADERITINPLGSYETWSRRVREALVWLGCADPCETMASARRADPITSQLSNIIVAWRSSVGVNKPMPVQALVEMANRVDLGGAHAHPDLREALLAVAVEGREINVRRLGKWLSKNEDRVIDRHKIARADAQTSVVRWLIAEVI